MANENKCRPLQVITICHVSGTTLNGFTITLKNPNGSDIGMDADTKIAIDIKAGTNNQRSWRFSNYGTRDSDIDDSDVATGKIKVDRILKWDIDPLNYSGDLLILFADDSSKIAARVNFHVTHKITS